MHSIFWTLIVLSLVAVLMRMDWVYYLIYVVGGIWVFSHWWVRRSLTMLRVKREVEDRAFPGETLTARFTIHNNSRLPLPWLHVQERVPFALRDAANYRVVLTVPGQLSVECDFPYRCTKRGYYDVGPMGLQTGDLFGFVSTEWEERQTQSIIVYPNVVSLERLGLPSRSPFGNQASKQRLFEDPARLSGVRDYTPGDSMRSVHWKASAREGELVVKKFQPAIDLNVALVLDLNKNAYPINQAVGASEWAIVVAASIASHIVNEQRQSVGLITNGIDPLKESVSEAVNPLMNPPEENEQPLPPNGKPPVGTKPRSKKDPKRDTGEIADAIPTRNGRGHLMGILSLLARVEMSEMEQALSDWLPRQLTDIAWGTTIVVIAPTLDEPALWMLHNAYRRGSNVIALLCAADADFQVLQARGERLGIQVYRSKWEKDLRALSE